MTGVLQRHKIIVVIFGLIIFISLVWFLIMKQNTNKIPSRGVFVMHSEPFTNDASKFRV